MYLFVLFQNGEFHLLESYKKGIWERWGDGLVNKVQAVQAGRLKLDPPQHKVGLVAHSAGMTGTGRFLGVPRQLVLLLGSSRFSERHCLIK